VRLRSDLATVRRPFGLRVRPKLEFADSPLALDSILQLDNVAGFRQWRMLFFVEGLCSVRNLPCFLRKPAKRSNRSALASWRTSS
jgi:hypothetical protein